jgi:hypothetical protein
VPFCLDLGRASRLGDPATQKQVFATCFTHHALESCLLELLRAGKRVAVCESVVESGVEPPAAATRATLFDYVACDGDTVEK